MVRNPMSEGQGACQTARATQVPDYRPLSREEQRCGLQARFRATLTEASASHAEADAMESFIAKPTGPSGRVIFTPTQIGRKVQSPRVWRFSLQNRLPIVGKERMRCA